MGKDCKILLLNLPSPPNQTLWRENAGGFGTAISINPRWKESSRIPLIPFFPYASSILLNEGYEFKVIDCQRLNLDNDQSVRLVKKVNPDIIFSIISLPSMKNDVKVLDEIKEFVPSVKIVGVGTVCRVLPHEVLLRGKIDVVLRSGYPYIANMIKLIRALQQNRNLKTVEGISFVKNRQIFTTSKPTEMNFNELPKPCYDLIPPDGYETFEDENGERFPYVAVLDSIGCPYNCIYCPYPLGFGRKYTYRPIKLVADEIEELYTRFNIRAFDFRSQAFAYNKKRALEICKELMQRKLDIKWTCESRVDEVNRELLEVMKKAGCRRIHFGVETGDPEILKVAKPGVKLETIEKVFKITKALGIIRQAHIILGWPDDDYRTLENTNKFILKLEPDILNLNFLTPYPGTKMYEIARKNSLILTYDWSKYTSYNIIMRTKSLNASDLYTIKQKMVRDFSKQKLKRLILQKDRPIVKRPQIFVNKAKTLVNRIIFPQF
ncbi:radical SAM protein [Candidatus Bathyarchaeota archaeon]|nr:radical SAM protein [Candidatus Bathyarchaeota archaeon]